MVFASLSFMFILLPLFLATDFAVRHIWRKKQSYAMRRIRKNWLLMPQTSLSLSLSLSLIGLPSRGTQFSLQ